MTDRRGIDELNDLVDTTNSNPDGPSRYNLQGLYKTVTLKPSGEASMKYKWDGLITLKPRKKVRVPYRGWVVAAGNVEFSEVEVKSEDDFYTVKKLYEGAGQIDGTREAHRSALFELGPNLGPNKPPAAFSARQRVQGMFLMTEQEVLEHYAHDNFPHEYTSLGVRVETDKLRMTVHFPSYFQERFSVKPYPVAFVDVDVETHHPGEQQRLDEERAKAENPMDSSEVWQCQDQTAVLTIKEPPQKPVVGVSYGIAWVPPEDHERE